MIYSRLVYPFHLLIKLKPLVSSLRQIGIPRFHLLKKLKPLVSSLRQIGLSRFHLLIILTATCQEFAADWRTPVSSSLLCGRLAYPFCVPIKLTATCQCFAADWGTAVSSNNNTDLHEIVLKVSLNAHCRVPVH